MQKTFVFTICCLISTQITAAQFPIPSLLLGNDPKKIALPVNNTFNSVDSVGNELVRAGGYGGNARIGKLTYAGKANNALHTLTVSRDSNTNLCYFENQNAIVKDYRHSTNFNDARIMFGCNFQDPNHFNLYWNGEFGAVNGGYSPENDTLYAADVVTNMFVDWYGIPPLQGMGGMHVPINFYLHANIDNMYFPDAQTVVVGDGVSKYHPLTSLKALGYAIGALFTQGHADLEGVNSQSGAIGIAFNCMTAMAAEFYLTGKNTWEVGSEFSKNGQAIHYLDQPSKNCLGRTPGDNCAIDHFSQYKNNMSGYNAAGLYNRAFYLLATTPGWDTHKAYNIFFKANERLYWSYNTQFHDGLCSVVKVAREEGYDTAAVIKAFGEVGIDTHAC